MKKLIITAVLFASVAGLVGCGGARGEDPGEAYMPDMYYSRAYETYGYNNVEGEWDSLKNRGIFYNAMPVNGTIARGESMPFHYVSQSDSGRLVESNSFRNPLDTVMASKASMKEGERLYLVNCGICHGTALDGNGPLYNNGNGPFPVLPKSLIAADTKAFTDGHYFHVISFGKGAMGSYASQLTPDQRWWVIKYIRAKQGGGAGKTTDSTSTATTSGAVDTTKKG